MAGTVILNLDFLPAFDDRSDEVPIRVGRNRWVSHRGTIVPPDGEPVWPLADDCDIELFPRQGEWNEADLLKIIGVSKLIEFTDGRLEFLPMPNERHQNIIFFLVTLLKNLLDGTGGKVMFAPFYMDTLPGKYREPDVLVMLAENKARTSNERWLGADIVFEIVSEDDPARDYHQKRTEYAAAGIREYWIVDPTKNSILVLTLEGDSYRQAASVEGDAVATSVLIPEFSVKASEVFAVGA